MQRSQVNAIIRAAEAFLATHGVALPPFATWTPRDFRSQPDVAGILAPRLGWDVTDFGTGDFSSFGLTLLTLRNGTVAPSPESLRKPTPRRSCSSSKTK